MKIEISNKISNTFHHIFEKLQDVEIKVIKDISQESFDKSDADLVIIEKDIKNFSYTKKTPYILMFSSKMPKSEIDWIDPQWPENLILSRLQKIFQYIRTQKQRCNLKKQIYNLNELAVIGKIAFGIIHELNNPLQVMLGFIEDIYENLSEETDLKEDMKVIKEEADRCCWIVRSVKFLKNIKNEMGFQDVEFILENIIPLLQYHVRKKRIQLEKHIEANLHFIKDTDNKTHSAIIALLITSIENAKKESSISIVAKNDGNRVSLSIEYTPQEKNTSFTLPLKEYIESIDGKLYQNTKGKEHNYTLKFDQMP